MMIIYDNDHDRDHFEPHIIDSSSIHPELAQFVVKSHGDLQD